MVSLVQGLSSVRATVGAMLKISPGSYAGAGYLISSINSTGAISNYARYLDLDQAIARTVWTQGDAVFQRYTTLFGRLVCY